MIDSEIKADCHRYLQSARDALLWKLERLTDYEMRRPLVASGTNLLGLVKHVAGMESEYFGLTFGRPFPEELPWLLDDADPNSDLWVTAGESRAEIVDLYRRVWVHSDATIEALPLDTVGRVPWWAPDHRDATLHRIIVHVIAETQRHAGHADLVRELVDGAAGLRQNFSNMPDGDAAYWISYRERVEQAARQADGI